MRRWAWIGLFAFLFACQSGGAAVPGAPSQFDGGACLDLDQDGFGEGCARGRDCDDSDPAVRNQCFACIEPEQGCACAAGSEPVACYLGADELPGGRLMCHEGTRFCRDGEWSGCESVHSYVMDRPQATRLVADAGHPNCTPCDVLCFRIDDNLDPIDAGLNDANSSSVDWQPGGGIGIHSFLLDAGGGSMFDGAIDSDASVPTCQLGVPPDTDCDGLNDDVDPYPGTPPFATDHDIIYHQLAAGQTGTSRLDLTFNLNNADVYFLLDQSGSMDGERDKLISDLRTGTFLAPGYQCADTDFDGTPNNELKSQGIIGSVRCVIRDAWFGTGYFVDYALPNLGDAYADGRSDDETPFRNLQTMTQSIQAVDDALGKMFTNGNISTPESDVPALWALATGQGMYLGHARQGLPPQTSCPPGTHGYACFRDTAISIVVLVTDASFHNGPAPKPNAYAATYNVASGTFADVIPVPDGNETFATAYDVGDITNRLLTLAGDTTSATADVPGNLMGCGASSTTRDVVFKFDVTEPKEITIKTDGTVQDTLITLFSDLPETAPSATIPVAGESYSAGDVYDTWIEYTGDTSAVSNDIQGSVVGCSAGGTGRDVVVSFTPSQNMTVTARSALQKRVSWFRMGDGDVYPDIEDVTGDHDGVMTNMASNDLVMDVPTPGSFANAYSIDFDGSNDVIVVSDDDPLDIVDEITVSVWLKGASQDNTVVSKFATSGNQRSWRIAVIGTKARINVSNTGGPYNSANVKEWNTSVNVLDGTWHHVAFTYAAGTPDGTLKVYVDGVEDTAVTRTYNPAVPSLFSSTAPVVIGGHAPSSDPFVGLIDEVAIWNTVLTANEMALVYNGGHPPDLNAIGGATVALYTAPPLTRPVATAVANTNSGASSATNATSDLVGSYLSFSGDTSASTIASSLTAANAGCGAASDSGNAIYRFQLSQPRRVRIDTEASSFDTVLSLFNSSPNASEARTSTNTNETQVTAQAIGALDGKRYVYSGDTGSMVPNYQGGGVGCGASGGAADAVYSFTLSAPRTVLIDSSSTAFNSVISLHSALPSFTGVTSANTNDTLSTAQSVGTVNNARYSFNSASTAGLVANYSGDVVGCGATDAGRDAVVDFTLTSAATVEIDTQGSSFDTVVALFDNTTAAEHLVTWHRMGDGDTYPTLLDSISGRNGTMTSMAANDIESVVPTEDYPNAKSINFDGSNDVTVIADNNVLDFTTAMTASAWIKGAPQDRTIIAKHQSTSDQRSWRLYGDTSGYLWAGVSGNGQWTATSTKLYRTTTAIALDSTWHHVAFTFDNGALKLFVDGAEAATTITNDGAVTSMFAGTSAVTIGAHYSGSATGYFAGNIDEVTLWKTALSAAQINQLYNGGAPTNPSAISSFPTVRPAATNIAQRTALDLDGSNDYLTAGTDAALNITNNLSVSMWANVNTNTRTLISRYRTTGNRRLWRMMSEGGRLRVIVSANGVFDATNAKDYQTTATNVFGNGWVHVAFTFANNVLTLYVNGVAVPVTQNYNGTVNTISSSTVPQLLIGGYENNASTPPAVTEFPDGEIDEVSIWTAVLTGPQVAALYNAGVPTDLTGAANLFAWWRMGEGSTYPTIVDRVAGRNLTMTNMTTDDFVSGVPGSTYYGNEDKATAHDFGVINQRWKVYSGDTTAMSRDGPGYGCGSDTNARDAYFKFTLSSAASVTIDTINSAFDTTIGLFPASATSFNSGELIQCDDDSGGGFTDSLVSGTLPAGTYYVVVKGDAAGDRGAYELSIRDTNGTSIANNTLGTRVACSDDDGTETTSRITTTLPAGTYHAVIKSKGGSGAYNLRIADQSVSTGRIDCAAPRTAASSAAPDSSCTFRVFGNHGYWFCSTLRNWNDARNRCLAVGHDLVTINDADEQAFIQTHRVGLTHIGVNDIASEGTYVWASGQPLTYTAWGSGQPNASGDQDCSEIYYADGTWNDSACSNSNAYVCEATNNYPTAIQQTLAAGTYYVVVKGDGATSEGAYSFSIEDVAANEIPPLMCNDDATVDHSSAIEADLAAGTYYVAVKGKSAAGEGAYRVTMRDVTGLASNRIACGNDSVSSALNAGQTYYAVVKGDAVQGDGPFSLILQDASNTGDQRLACDDNGGPGQQSQITRMLNPGTYYLAMKKSNQARGQGFYQISMGGAPSVTGTYAPPTWAETISALNANDMHVMTVYSTGGTASDIPVLQQHAIALANATGAVGNNGDPLVSSMAGDGTGLSSALVDQIQQLAQFLEMDVQLRISYSPDMPPSPGFIVNFQAIDEAPTNGCHGVVGIEHQDCLPGATPRFFISITNPLGNPVPPNPSDPFGGYNFRVQLIANDHYIVDEVPIYIVPVATVQPPPNLRFDPVGTYWQDVDGRSCMGNQQPSWRDLLFNTTTAPDTSIHFEACTGDDANALRTCTYRSVVTVAGINPCFSQADCALGDTCESNGVCRRITGGGCATTTDCAGTATCINNLCTYAGSPVSLLQGIGAANDYRRMLRLKMTLNSNATHTAGPIVDQWQIRYQCADIQ